MLKILPGQMTQLAERAQADFVVAMRSHLRSGYPERCGSMSDDELTGLIREGMERARSHGIEIDFDIQRYLELMVVLGPRFDRELDWAAAILGRADFSARIRVDLLCAAHEGRVPERPEDGPFFP